MRVERQRLRAGVAAAAGLDHPRRGGQFAAAYDVAYDDATGSTRGRGLVVVGELSRWPHTSRTYTLRAGTAVEMKWNLRAVDPPGRP